MHDSIPSEQGDTGNTKEAVLAPQYSVDQYYGTRPSSYPSGTPMGIRFANTDTEISGSYPTFDMTNNTVNDSNPVGISVNHGTKRSVYWIDSNRQMREAYSTDSGATWYPWAWGAPGKPCSFCQTALLFGTPAVASPYDGRYEVYALAISGSVRYIVERVWDAGTWQSDWLFIALAPDYAEQWSDEGVAAVSWGSGRTDLFIRNSISSFAHYYSTNQWSSYSTESWSSIGGETVIGSASVASTGPGLIDLFYHGYNGGIGHISYNNGAYSQNYFTVPCPSGTSLTALRGADGFYAGNDHPIAFAAACQPNGSSNFVPFSVLIASSIGTSGWTWSTGVSENGGWTSSTGWWKKPKGTIVLTQH